MIERRRIKSYNATEGLGKSTQTHSVQIRTGHVLISSLSLVSTSMGCALVVGLFETSVVALQMFNYH